MGWRGFGGDVGEKQQLGRDQSLKPDASKCLGLLALGPRALPRAENSPQPHRLGLGSAFCTGPTWPQQGLYSHSHPLAPRLASRLKVLNTEGHLFWTTLGGARRMGLGEQRQNIKKASWHPLVGALVCQPDTGLP